MIRLMVQGDRDAKGIEEAVRALGTLCKERGIGLNVGEAGEIVRILAEAGAHVRVHQTKPERPNVPEGFTGTVINCFPNLTTYSQLAPVLRNRREGDQQSRLTQRTAWGLRLACLDVGSDGFIFFPGREGTLAHLVPIMAFIAKGERDKGVARPRRIVLMGWRPTHIRALERLFGHDIPYMPEGNLYCIAMEQHFEDEGSEPSIANTAIEGAIDWLVDGLPATT